MHLSTIIVSLIALLLLIQNKQLKDKVNNRDIPEIIKIETEKQQLQQEKEQAIIAKYIKEGSFSFEITRETLKQILDKLTNKTIYIKYEHPNLVFNDKTWCYTIKNINTTDKNIKGCYWNTLTSKDITITKKINRKEFINDLKAITTSLVDISFSYNSNQIFIYEPNSAKYICCNSRN